MRASLLLSLVMLCALWPSHAHTRSGAPSDDKTEVADAAAGARLLGRHKFQLHWISWDKWKEFGELSVTDSGGTYLIKGRQTKGEDYVEIDGRMLRVDAKKFTFRGRIVTRVSYKNEGRPCEREGAMTFEITGRRKYWR